MNRRGFVLVTALCSIGACDDPDGEPVRHACDENVTYQGWEGTKLELLHSEPRLCPLSNVQENDALRSAGEIRDHSQSALVGSRLAAYNYPENNRVSFDEKTWRQGNGYIYTSHSMDYPAMTGSIKDRDILEYFVPWESGAHSYANIGITYDIGCADCL